MTHAELVQIATRWLRNTQRCGVVFTEHTAGTEFPDAMGWRSGWSILVECKVSRADFFADRKKPSRASVEARPAWQCFYLTPPGLVTPDEVPDGWGLLEYRNGKVYIMKALPEHIRHFDERETAALRQEIYRLYQEVRRYQVQGLKPLTYTAWRDRNVSAPPQAPGAREA